MASSNQALFDGLENCDEEVASPPQESKSSNYQSFLPLELENEIEEPGEKYKRQKKKFAKLQRGLTHTHTHTHTLSLSLSLENVCVYVYFCMFGCVH